MASSCRKSQAQAPTDPSCILVDNDWGPDGSVPFTVEVVAEGLEVPWGIAFLPGGDALVTERPGRVRLLRGGVLQPQPVANVRIASSSEGGLLGIAAHPAFATNRQFYVYVTTDAAGHTENRVERWTLSEDHASATFERVILDGIPSAQFHDGGRLRFGPDGMLYVGTGDAREPDHAQDPKSPSGKLLRLTPDGEVPADNPPPGLAGVPPGHPQRRRLRLEGPRDPLRHRPRAQRRAEPHAVMTRSTWRTRATTWAGRTSTAASRRPAW